MRREIAAVVLAVACAAAVRAQTGSAAGAAGPTVEQVLICTGVTGRDPVGVGETFSSTIGRLCCFTKIVGVKDSMSIQHKWYHGDELRGTITLPVKAATWRTYSSKMIAEVWTGPWHVDVVDAASGTVLATAKFTIQ